MKILLILIITFCATSVFAQTKTDLEKVVETEKFSPALLTKKECQLL